MSAINLSFKHNRTLEEARHDLAEAVAEARARLGPMVQRTDWAADGRSVTLTGTGFRVEARVDERAVHVTGDVVFGVLLGGPVQQLLENVFRQRLALEKPRNGSGS
jgi:hypothetical protein